MKMILVTTLSLSLLGLLAEVSGGPVGGGECSKPLWNVIGNHWTPTESCEATKRFDSEEVLRQKLYEELTAGVENPDLIKLNQILDEMMKLHPANSKNLGQNYLMCSACWTGVEIYRFLHEQKVPSQKIFDVLAKICSSLHILTPNICAGAIQTYGVPLTQIIDKSHSTTNHVCSVILNAKCGHDDIPELNWNVTLPLVPKPPVVPPIPVSETVKKLKVLHISDTHWDTQYQEGTWDECNLPLCCRKENVLPNKYASKAGKYGGWRCDTPEETFDSMLKHITEQHPDIDYIIWTGDIPAHDIWNQSRDDNLSVLKKTVAKIYASFPKVPIYPALGNHESAPSNLFPTGEEGNTENPMSWLYNEVHTQWSRWLPKNQSNTVRLGAFYSTLVRPGLRIVSMNMNYCYRMNWWLIVDGADPVNELQWFVQILQEAEKNKEKVHVIGHIPPGYTDCLKVWQTNYYNIINRYEGTVTAQFFGHTHADEFEVFYDMKNHSRPFGVAYVGPSLTTYMYHNPSYRIYYVEGDHKQSHRFVLDHETWYLDLVKSNQQNKAEWKKLYNAKDAYNMKYLYPEDWHKIYLQIKNNDATLQKYHKFYWNDSPKRGHCGKSCRRSRLCDIRSCAQYGDPTD